jgi:hypothetical protein
VRGRSFWGVAFDAEMDVLEERKAGNVSYRKIWDNLIAVPDLACTSIFGLGRSDPLTSVKSPSFLRCFPFSFGI